MARSLLSREERRGVLSLREEHGLTYAELSELTGIRAGTLCAWARQESGERSGGRAPPFTELVVRDAGAGGAFELELSRGRRLRVPFAFDAEALGRLLAILERSC